MSIELSNLPVSLEDLLAPISESSPSGENPRGDDPDTLYYHVRQSRREAVNIERALDEDAIEPQEGNSSPERFHAWLAGSSSKWNDVSRDARQILQQECKDLEVATYLCEAMFRQNGFAGLTAGVRLISELLAAHWDSIHPRRVTEDGEADSTVVVRDLGHLCSDTMCSRINRYPLTGDSASIGPFGNFQWEEAQKLSSLDGDSLQKEIDRGKVTKEAFQRAVAETEDQELRDTYRALSAAIDEYTKLDSFLENKDVEDRPFFNSAVSMLENCRKTLRVLAEPIVCPPEETPMDEDAEAGAADAAGAGGTSTGVTGSIKTREQAFQLMEKVAEFFEKTEPQSLLPAAIRKQIRRGRMSAAQLMAEVLENRDARESLFKEYDMPLSESPPDSE